MKTTESSYFLNNTLRLPDNYKLPQDLTTVTVDDLFLLLTVDNKSRNDGSDRTQTSNLKQNIFDFIAGRPVDLQMIFEQAYSLGMNASNTYRQDVMESIIRASNQIYGNVLAKIEKITDEGTAYLPQDTITPLLQCDYSNRFTSVKQIVLAGFAAGVTLTSNNTSVDLKEPPKPSSVIEHYFNLPQAKQLIMQALAAEPTIILDRLFEPQTTIEILELERKILDTTLPGYIGERIKPILDAKKRAKTSLTGGRTVRMWAKEYEDPNFELGWNMIQTASIDSPTGNAIESLLFQKIRSRVGREITIDEKKRIEANLKEFTYALLNQNSTMTEMSQYVINIAAQFNLSKTDTPDVPIDSLPLTLPDLLSVLKTTIAKTASKIGELQLVKNILKKDIALGNIPSEIQEMIEIFLIRYMQQQGDVAVTEEIVDRFRLFLDTTFSRKRNALTKNGKSNEQFYKKFVPDEMLEEVLSIEQQTAVLIAISPFDTSYLAELPESEIRSIFYRYIMALSTLAECNKIGARNKFLNLINQSCRRSSSNEELQRNASALIEYGMSFEDLTDEEQKLAASGEAFDEINHFIRVVTGLRFEPKVDGQSRLRVRNINKQFLKMIEVTMNKKIARGILKRSDVCPPPYDDESYEDNVEQLDTWTSFNKRNNYPYLQSILSIPGINTRDVSRFFNALVMKYPLEFAVPILLYTFYEQYGDLDISAVITQGYENGTDQRQLKCYVIGEGSVQTPNNGNINLVRDAFSKNQISSGVIAIPKDGTEFTINAGNPNQMYQKSVVLPKEMKQRIAVEWNDEIARKVIEKPLSVILKTGPQDRSRVINCEFFHIHADEPKATDTQYMSAMIARAMQQACEGTNVQVIGMPVVDNAHVTDRIDYQQYVATVREQGITVPDIMFEGSLLMQKIGDELYKYIEPERLIRRGDNVYFKVNDFVEVELYTGIDRIATQACVLNHITNDLYRLNPQGANNAFRNYLAQYYPQSPLAQEFIASDLSYEQFYLKLLSQETEPQKRELIKQDLSNQLGKSLEAYMAEDASSILRSLIESVSQGQTIIPVQILEGFFGEQGNKYRALLEYLSTRVAGLQDVAIFRLAYDPYTGEISLITLSKDQNT